jgi:hypothetical protein
MAKRKRSPAVVLTIGHSNRSLTEFMELLQAHGVTAVVDVRKLPGSRHNPQFNRTSLPTALHAVGIGYVPLAELGGLRRPLAGSANTGWRNKSFRAYADYMQTAGFAAGIDQLIRLAEGQRIALMCAEAVPWRCHRMLIADALTIRGIAVEDILGPGRRRPHRLAPWARVAGTRITYPEPDESQAAAAQPARGKRISLKAGCRSAPAQRDRPARSQRRARKNKARLPERV